MLPPSTLLYTITILLANLPRPGCAIEVDFSAYPSSSRDCLENEATASGCLGETVTEINLCLCGNVGNFVLNTAYCVGQIGGKDIVTDVYQVMETSCSETKTPMDISQAEFYAASNNTSSSSDSSDDDSSSSSTSDNDNDNDSTDDGEEVLFSAKIGLIMAIIVAVLMVVCIICLIVLIKKRRRDKALLLKAQEDARQHAAAAAAASAAAVAAGGGDGRSRDRYDKPLLEAGAMTPGFQSPAGSEGFSYQNQHAGGGQARRQPPFGATVLPRLDVGQSQYYRPQQQELSGEQMPLELIDTWRAPAPGHLTHWPSPVSQGVGTMGSWCPSPMTTTTPELLANYYQQQQQEQQQLHQQQLQSIGALPRVVESRTSWVHDMPTQDGPYELSGTEIRSPVEADSVPVTIRPDRLSMTISAAPPQYERGDWNDPITDKPPI